jgi:hypothetical protein
LRRQQQFRDLADQTGQNLAALVRGLGAGNSSRLDVGEIRPSSLAAATISRETVAGVAPVMASTTLADFERRGIPKSVFL